MQVYLQSTYKIITELSTGVVVLPPEKQKSSPKAAF